MNRRRFLFLSVLGGLELLCGCVTPKKPAEQVDKPRKFTISKEPTHNYNIIKDYKRKYNTSAHRVLDLEKELGTAHLDYKVIDDLIAETEKRIGVSPDGKHHTVSINLPTLRFCEDERAYATFDRSHVLADSVTVLRLLTQVLENNGFKIDDANLLLNKGLKTRKISSDNVSFLYIAIAEALDLPVYPINTPGCMAVMWKPSTYNFICYPLNESLWAEKVASGTSNLTEEEIKKRNLFKPLTKEQALATAHYNIGSFWLKKTEQTIEGIINQKKTNPQHINNAVKSFNKSIELNPSYFKAYYSRGLALFKKLDFDNAINDFSKVIELNNNHVEAYYNRGLSWHHKKEYSKAVDDICKVIDHNPEYPGAIASLKTMKKEIEEEQQNLLERQKNMLEKKQDMANKLQELETETVKRTEELYHNGFFWKAAGTIAIFTGLTYVIKKYIDKEEELNPLGFKLQDEIKDSKNNKQTA